MGLLIFYLGKLDLKDAFEISAIQFLLIVIMYWLGECVDCIQSSFVGVLAFPGQWRCISVA